MKKQISVISVGAVLLAGLVLLTIHILPNKAQVARVSARDVEELSQKIKDRFRNSPSYWGLDSKFVTDSEMWERREGIEVLVGTGFEGLRIMPGGKTFDIVLRDLSKQECVVLAKQRLSEEAEMSLISIIINGNGQESSFGWGEENSLPISAKDARKFCAEKSNVLWRFE